MSETPEEKSDVGVSRRDFLRRAGRDAVTVGVQASPTNLVKVAVGLSAKTPWWRKLAAWRKDRAESEETEPEERKETEDDDG